MNAETYQRVYVYHCDNVLLRGYAPTGAAVCHALHLSRRDYYAALRWLEARRFVSVEPRRWRNVTVNMRLCNDCGMELTPANAVFYTAHNGRLYMRRPCRACFNAKSTERKRTFRAANPGYNMRWQRRTREQQRSAS